MSGTKGARLCCLFVAMVFQSNEASAAPPRPQSLASLSGTIVRAGTEQPVMGARVLLSKNDGRTQSQITTVLSDIRGQFVMTNVPPGSYRLNVEHADYLKAELGQIAWNKPGVPVELSAGGNVSVRIAMTPIAAIAGRLVNENGEPLTGFEIRAMQAQYQEGEKFWHVAGRVQTNDRGEFRVFGLAPGPYVLGAFMRQITTSAERAATPAAALVTTPAKVYWPIFYGAARDAAQATPISLTPGATFDVGVLRGEVAQSVHLRGKVIDGTTGQPALNADVSVTPPITRRSVQGDLVRSSNSDVFDFAGIQPGRYQLEAQISRQTVAGGKREVLEASLPVEIGDKDLEVELVLEPRRTFDLSGRIVIEGRPGGANDSALGQIYILLPNGHGRVGASGRRANADGSMSITGILPGSYRLNLTGLEPNAYVKQVRLGSIDVLKAGLVLTSTPQNTLDVLISPNGGRVDVSVASETGNPIHDVTVVLVPDPARREHWELYKKAVTDVRGEVQFQGIAPGEYKVFAWTDVQEGQWTYAEFIQSQESKGTTIRIAEGSRNRLALKR